MHVVSSLMSTVVTPLSFGFLILTTCKDDREVLAKNLPRPFFVGDRKMGVSKAKRTALSKTGLCGHKRKKVFSSLLNSHFLAEISRRKGSPLHFSAGKLPTRCIDKPKTSDAIAESRSRDSLARSVLSKPFKKVCELLLELDADGDYGLISETILHFSLRIYGLPKCRTEDLPLAVYFFVEDTFAIRSKIVLCVELEEEGEPSVVGVVFETIRMKYAILGKELLLEGSGVRLRDNTNLDWITEALCAN